MSLVLEVIKILGFEASETDVNTNQGQELNDQKTEDSHTDNRGDRDLQIDSNLRDEWKVGDTAWFEYHCSESEDSDDADLWYRSHQQVTVVDVPNPEDYSYGDGKTLEERMENASPRSYTVKFSDGVESRVIEDELFTSKDDFYRPDPPRKKGAVEAPGVITTAGWMSPTGEFFSLFPNFSTHSQAARVQHKSTYMDLIENGWVRIDEGGAEIGNLDNISSSQWSELDKLLSERPEGMVFDFKNASGKTTIAVEGTDLSDSGMSLEEYLRGAASLARTSEKKTAMVTAWLEKKAERLYKIPFDVIPKDLWEKLNNSRRLEVSDPEHSQVSFYFDDVMKTIDVDLLTPNGSCASGQLVTIIRYGVGTNSVYTQNFIDEVGGEYLVQENNQNVWRKTQAEDKVKMTVSINDLTMDIEWPKGSERTFKGSDDKVKMTAAYGYVPATSSYADGDALDIYLGDNPESKKVFKLQQLKKDGTFDEEKFFIGFDTIKEAEKTYESMMPKEMNGGFTEMSWEQFMSLVKHEQKKEEVVELPKDELVQEHEHLVDVLKSPDHADDLEEAKKQEKELKEYKEASTEDDESLVDAEGNCKVCGWDKWEHPIVNGKVLWCHSDKKEAGQEFKLGDTVLVPRSYITPDASDNREFVGVTIRLLPNQHYPNKYTVEYGFSGNRHRALVPVEAIVGTSDPKFEELNEYHSNASLNIEALIIEKMIDGVKEKLTVQPVFDVESESIDHFDVYDEAGVRMIQVPNPTGEMLSASEIDSMVYNALGDIRGIHGNLNKASAKCQTCGKEFKPEIVTDKPIDMDRNLEPGVHIPKNCPECQSKFLSELRGPNEPTTKSSELSLQKRQAFMDRFQSKIRRTAKASQEGTQSVARRSPMSANETGLTTKHHVRGKFDLGRNAFLLTVDGVDSVVNSSESAKSIVQRIASYSDASSFVDKLTSHVGIEQEAVLEKTAIIDDPEEGLQPTKKPTNYAKCQTPGCGVEYYIGGYPVWEPVPMCPECKGPGEVVQENIWPPKKGSWKEDVLTKRADRGYKGRFVYEVKPEDVGKDFKQLPVKELTFQMNSFGRVMPSDVGRWLFDVGDGVIQMESTEQRDMRLGKQATASNPTPTIYEEQGSVGSNKPGSAKVPSMPVVEAVEKDFAVNQDVNVGDKVIIHGKQGTVTEVRRTQDVYKDEQDFERFKEIYGLTGLDWVNNSIVTVYVEYDDNPGIDVEYFAYEIESVKKSANLVEAKSKRIDEKHDYIGKGKVYCRDVNGPFNMSEMTDQTCPLCKGKLPEDTLQDAKMIEEAMDKEGEEVLDDTPLGDDPSEPNEDDVIIQGVGRLGAGTAAFQDGKEIAHFHDDWDAFYGEILEWMKANSYYPTVWNLSDHGNATVDSDFIAYTRSHK